MLNELQVDRLPLGGVLVVDEAGMLGDRQLAELVSLAARDEAKLVVVGDPSQLQPIEAGAPMRTLSEHIGRVLAHREHPPAVEPWERATLQLLRDGEARAAYREYVRYDRIHVAALGGRAAGPSGRAIMRGSRPAGSTRSSLPSVVTRLPPSTSSPGPGRLRPERVHGPALTVR